MLPLDCALSFDPRRDAEFFASLPARPAVFVLEPRAADAQPYLARTADLRRRLERLLRAPAEQAKRLNLREFAAGVRYRVTGSAFEQALAYYQQARHLFPDRYRDLLPAAGGRPPALLKINLRNPYPRCYVTRRILDEDGFYCGPFPSRRAAESFAGEFLNLFNIRRCQIRIRRDPSFPGCIYSEMKMCLAPCFAGCTKEEYDVEVGRVVRTLASGGGWLRSELEREREAASEALDFERAAAVHKRHEKMSGVLRDLPEIVRPVGELGAVVLQRAAEEGAVAVFLVERGFIGDPFVLRFHELASQPRSVEQILREQFEEAAAQSAAECDDAVAGKLRGQTLAEHLSLLARWYYSKPRAGEIFFPRSTASAARPEWPYRRILRACSRLLSADPSPPPAPAAGSTP